MDLRKRGLFFLFCLWIMPQTAFPGDFDGIKPLSGSVDKIVEINAFKIIDDVDPDTVGLPRNFFIDFKEKKLRPSKDSLVRKTSRIDRVAHIENKLILQGVDEGVESVDDGLAWSITISKKTGKAVLSASGDGVAYVVFATCIPVDNYQK
ncbi:MAG: hypothetical protein JRE88_16920 [Deltaproteobacteria bacterium]|nr:hypothetical protein [Deltaproteobacteria bacterium]